MLEPGAVPLPEPLPLPLPLPLPPNGLPLPPNGFVPPPNGLPLPPNGFVPPWLPPPFALLVDWTIVTTAGETFDTASTTAEPLSAVRATGAGVLFGTAAAGTAGTGWDVKVGLTVVV